jgi:hypothetical protein
MMVDLLRIAFVNTSGEISVTIHVETQDAVECCELLTTTPATGPEQNPGTTHPAGGWDLIVSPGHIVGFVTEKPVKIVNPNPAAVTTIYAHGKNPWPLPPPLTPLASVADFSTRYESFLMGGAVPDSSPRSIVMTLGPAHPAR